MLGQLVFLVHHLDDIQRPGKRIEGHAAEGIRVAGIAPVVAVPPLQPEGDLRPGDRLPLRIYEAVTLDGPGAEVDVLVPLRILSLTLEGEIDERLREVTAVVSLQSVWIYCTSPTMPLKSYGTPGSLKKRR